MTPAELTRDGDAYIWHFKDQNVAIGFDQLRETSDGLYGEISVETNRPLNGTQNGHYHWAKINLASTRGRADVLRALKDRDMEGIDWSGLLEIACVKTAEAFRAGEPVLDLSQLDETSGEEYLVGKILPKGETATLFADGGSGKSVFALAVACAVRLGVALPGGLKPSEPRNVLYLDWETNAQVATNRSRWLARGMNYKPVPILYRAMWRGLADDIEFVRKEVDRHHVGLVVVDSIVPALAGEANQENVGRLFNALRSLAGTSRLVISHVSHEGANVTSGQANPFGSRFIRNLSRSLWELRRSDDEGDTLRLGLYHRKVNDGPLHAPIGLAIRFDNKARTIRLEALDVEEDASLAGYTSLRYRIHGALKRGKMTTSALAEFLEASPKAIVTTCRRMSDVQSFGGGRGRGNESEWSLIAEGGKET